MVNEECNLEFELLGEGCSNYRMHIEGPNNFEYNDESLTSNFYEIPSIFNNGVYTIRLISTSNSCNDQPLQTFNVSNCYDPIQICQNINNSATGTGDWQQEFISDGDGFLHFTFNSLQVPDQLIVKVNGIEKVNSGFYSARLCQEEVNDRYPYCNAIGGDPICDNPDSFVSFEESIEIGLNDIIEVEIDANNCNQPNTIWILEAFCNAVPSKIRNQVSFEEIYKIHGDLAYSEFNNAKQLNNINIYPNPTKGIINIEIDKFNEYKNYSILDISGKVLISEDLDDKKVSMNLSHLPSGIYIIRLQGNNGKIISKRVFLEGI